MPSTHDHDAAVVVLAALTAQKLIERTPNAVSLATPSVADSIIGQSFEFAERFVEEARERYPGIVEQVMQQS